MTVHVLVAGRALCGAGSPDLWLADDRWVNEWEADKATCQKCQERATKRAKRHT